MDKSRNNVGIFLFYQEARLIMETKLIDIQVYNRSIEEFNKYWNQKLSKLYRRADMTDDEWERYLPLIKELNKPATNWKFQNVIGYISIFKHGYSLFATLSIDIRKKKYIEGRPDIRYNPSTFFSLYVKEEMTSEQIRDKFNDLLHQSIKERLPKRYIDLEAWDNMNKLVDWHKVFYPQNEENEKDNRSEEDIIRERYALLGQSIEMPTLTVDF